MTRRACGSTLAAVAVLLAAPSAAGAVTYCVAAWGTSEADLQTALNAAAASTAVADTVQVGNPAAPPASSRCA